MDDFEKCYAILKVCKKVNGNLKPLYLTCSFPSFFNGVYYSDTKDWVARRVDLIVVPYSQFPFAVLGWSGTKVNTGTFLITTVAS